MATLTIRQLPEETRRALKQLAALNDRSMEAEARAILQAAVEPQTGFISAWLNTSEQLRGEFETPERSAARTIDLS